MCELRGCRKCSATMESRMAIWALGMLFFTMVVGGQYGGVAAAAAGGSSNTGSANCRFPAIFNFGDSNSDTGASSAANERLKFPWGMSFRGNNSKRGSDGRLIIDYIAENLGLPYLDAPLDSIGTSFRQGANFATGGVTISPVVIQGVRIPMHLDVQVSQFLQFKSRTIAQSKQRENNSENPPMENNLPEPDVFSRALYTIDIGQNDINFSLYNSSIPTIIDQFSYSIQRLLGEGAKFFWVHNTGPLGCMPGGLYNCLKNKTMCLLDQSGCVKKLTDQAQDFNKQLKDRIYKLRAQYPDAAFTYVDMYSAKFKLIFNAANYGFLDDLLGVCWVPYVSLCNDPSRYISWDGTHYTQSANRIIANLIVDGSFSDPPVPIAEACHKL